MRRPLAFAVVAFATAFTILSGAQQRKPAAKKPTSADAEAAEAGTSPMAGREERTQPVAKGGDKEKDAGVVESKGGARDAGEVRAREAACEAVGR